MDKEDFEHTMDALTKQLQDDAEIEWQNVADNDLKNEIARHGNRTSERHGNLYMQNLTRDIPSVNERDLDAVQKQDRTHSTDLDDQKIIAFRQRIIDKKQVYVNTYFEGEPEWKQRAEVRLNLPEDREWRKDKNNSTQ